MEVKDRKDIDVKDTWNLESIYANNELWEEEYAALEKEAEEFAKLKGAIEADVSKIPVVLDAYYGLHRCLSKLSVYARMRSDQDTTDSTYQTMSAKIGSLGVKIGAASAFVEPEILSYSKEQLEAAEKENERTAYYGRKIEEMLRGQEHTLDAEKEELLAAAGDMAEAPDDIFSVLMNADMKYPDIVLEDGTHLPLTNSTYISYMESPDRAVREGAFKTLYGQIASLKNTFAAIYRGNLKQAKFYAQSRKYSSARAMYLADSNVPESVYDNLLSAVHEALPMMYRYVAVRKKVLGVDKLHMYDVYTPIVAAQNQTYEFDQAKQMVLEALKPMGEDYLSHAREGLENRWIDIYPNKGKKGGAYSWGCYDSQPFILLNYTKNLDSVFTLIHEMGHSIHSYYSRTAQDYAYSDYKIFVAEVASTCNECLLMHDLLEKTTDKEQRKYLLNHYLDSFKGTLFRQTMFAEFEKITHEKEKNNAILVTTLFGILAGLWCISWGAFEELLPLTTNKVGYLNAIYTLLEAILLFIISGKILNKIKVNGKLMLSETIIALIDTISFLISSIISSFKTVLPETRTTRIQITIFSVTTDTNGSQEINPVGCRYRYT